ncbi:MAG: sigma 54-interacting transcriptional regulator [Acidobacteriota bacterium]
MGIDDIRDPAEMATDTRVETGGLPGAQASRVPGLTILWHPEVRRIGERAPLGALDSGRAADLSRLTPEFMHPGGGPRHALEDSRLSRSPIRLIPGGRGLRLDPSESRTALEVDGSSADGPSDISEAQLERGVVLLLGGRIALLLHRIDQQVVDHPSYGLVGESPGLGAVRTAIRQVADLDVTVLLRGATGTGKELVAKAIHDASPRATGPFVAVNMAAIPAPLAAAELFGAAKGAFTGADRSRSGYFQRAEGGTLFLDEIGETPPEIQALLLRALETREIQSVGADHPRQVDVRVLSATDLDLESAVDDERFRGPLLYRLSSFVLRLPALEERRGDFGRLLIHFLRSELEAIGEGYRLGAPCTWFPASLCAKLALADWRGNVRQLANVARQLVIANRGFDKIQNLEPLDQLTPAPAQGRRIGSDDSATATADKGARRHPGSRRPSDVRESELIEALRRNRFRPQDTADELGIRRASLYDLMDKCPGIRKASDLGADEIRASLDAHGHSVERAAESLEVSAQALRRQLGKLGLSV